MSLNDVAENRGATRSDVTVSSSYGERSNIVHRCSVMREPSGRSQSIKRSPTPHPFRVEVSSHEGRDGSKGRWCDIRRGVIKRLAKQRVDPWRVVDVEGRM